TISGCMNNCTSGFVRGRTLQYVNLGGAAETSIVATNDNGMSLGTYSPDARFTHGFAFTDTANLTYLDVPGALVTAPRALNNNGSIVGYTSINGSGQPFIAIIK